MDKRRYILGVHVTDRVQKVPDVQQVFTDFGCYVRTRLGLHEVQGDYCSPAGLILLDLLCDEATCEEMRGKLAAIEGVEVQQMVFDQV
ncbi:MAG: hypothetical protein JXA57_17590 [Armatimonadetes bacterium]|nr:hypothetical protein [Armatimonadota bacterium]